MLKLLFAFGLLFGPLYRLLSGVQTRSSPGDSSKPYALFNFAPRLTIISRLDVPVNSRNVGTKAGAGPSERSGVSQNGKLGADNLSKGARVAAGKPKSAKLGAVKKAFLNSLG
jgi:hypothetical protein